MRFVQKTFQPNRGICQTLKCQLRHNVTFHCWRHKNRVHEKVYERKIYINFFSKFVSVVVWSFAFFSLQSPLKIPINVICDTFCWATTVQFNYPGLWSETTRFAVRRLLSPPTWH